MALPDSGPRPGEISGKKLVPMLAVGCLLFIAVGFGGTFLFAKLTAPYFAKSQEAAKRDAAAKMKLQQSQGRL